jgi:hypothetical protein
VRFFDFRRLGGSMRYAVARLLLCVGVAIAFFVLVTEPINSQTLATALGPKGIWTKIVAPTLALVQSQNGLKHGTAFCITAKDGVVYLLTNEHVIADERTGAPEKKLVVIFPEHPGQEFEGKPIKHGSVSNAIDKDGKSLVPDLAIIVVKAVPFPVAALKLNTVTPGPRMNITIAGFPQLMTDNWTKSQRRFLGIGTEDGSINTFSGAIGDAGTDIIYNAPTDEGDSGGPVYDPKSGSFYGVIREFQPGAVASVQYGLAIPASTVSSFVADVKDISVGTFTPSAESQESDQLHVAAPPPHHVAGTPACLVALARLSRDFGAWYQLRSAVINVHSPHAAQTVRQRLTKYDAALKADAHLVASTSNKRTAALTADLVSEVQTYDALQNTSRLAHLELTRSVDRFHGLNSCSPKS